MKLFLLLIATLALAAPPTITTLSPRGAQKGRPFELTITGKDIADGPAVVSTLPATFTPLVSSKPNEAKYLVEPTADWAVGTYTIRLTAPNGISNILLFSIGAFPELEEDETKPQQNDSIEKAQVLPAASVTVNGRLTGPERDVYRIPVKAGERRVFEVEARRIGSAIDPVIELYDATGKRIARSEDDPLLSLDPRLEMTFPREGVVYAQITDARYSSQMHDYYRFKTGTYTYPTEVFPLGGRRGETVELTIGKTPIKTRLDTRLTQTTVNLPDSPALGLPFAVGDFPEAREPLAAPPTLPITINGRLEKPGEVDRYPLAVKPGQQLLIELEARELGTSRLTGLLTLYGPTGKRLTSAGDGPLPVDVSAVQVSSRTLGDPTLTYTIPTGIDRVELAVEDLARRGGPLYAYRLKIREAASDIRPLIVSPYINIPAGGTAIAVVDVERRGYWGPLDITPTNLPAGIRVAGGQLPAETPDPTLPTVNRRALLSFTAEPNLRLPLTEIGFTVKGQGIEREAFGFAYLTPVNGATSQGVVDRQRALNGRHLGLRLPASTTTPTPATLELTLAEQVKKAEGFEYRFRWRWKSDSKSLAWPDTVNVDVPNLASIRIIEMEQDKTDKSTGTFLVTTSRNSVPGAYWVSINGRLAGMIDVSSPVIKIDLPELTKEEGKSDATNPAAR